MNGQEPTGNVFDMYSKTQCRRCKNIVEGFITQESPVRCSWVCPMCSYKFYFKPKIEGQVTETGVVEEFKGDHFKQIEDRGDG